MLIGILLNIGLNPTGYSATFNFNSADVSGITANYVVRNYLPGWISTVTGTRTSTSTSCTGTAFGSFAIGEINTLGVLTQPSDASVCSGFNTSFNAASTSLPAPTIQWQVKTGSNAYTNVVDDATYSGSNAATLSITAANAAMNGNKYRAVFTNINGNVISNEVTLTVNTTPSISGNPTATQTVCQNSTPANLMVTASGPGLSYKWYSNNSNANTGGTLIAGAVTLSYTPPTTTVGTMYYYVVASNGSCSATSNISEVIVDAPSTPTITAGSATSFCPGGSVTLTSSSATGNQWYVGGSLLGGATNPTYTATTGGTYTVIVTANGCASLPSTGTVVKVKSATTSTTNKSICPSALPYLWNGLTFNGAGSQTYHTTNAAGCDSAATLNLSILAVKTSEQTISRCGSYTWNGTTYNTSGDYVYTTTGSNTCDSVATLHLLISTTDTLRQTVNTCKSYTWNGYTYRKSGVYYYRSNVGSCTLVAVLTLNIPKLTNTVSVAQPLCRNNGNGSITVTAANGAAPYLYKNGVNGVYQSSGTFTGLFAATYRIYYQDANGCEDYTDSINLVNPSFVVATATVTPACYNTVTGKITVNATGGTGPYLYKNGANGMLQTSNVFTGLRNGVQYRMYVQDANGCIGYTSLITMTQSAAITATGTGNNATCYNTANGSVTVIANGGTTPYMYKIGTTGAYQSSNVFSGLSAGVQYRFYVQDASGCTANTALITLSQPAALSSTTTTTPPVCSGSATGTATIVPGSGAAPYQYKYNLAGTYQSSNTFTGLSGNTSFRLYFQDATGCIGTGDSVTLPDATKPCSSLIGRQAKSNTDISTHLSITLSPNPSSSQFILVAHAAGTQPVTLRVIDIGGKAFFQTKGQTEQPFRFGASFAPGIYLVEVRQGDEVQTVKAVKL